MMSYGLCAKASAVQKVLWPENHEAVQSREPESEAGLAAGDWRALAW